VFCGGDDRARILETASDVEQAEENAMRTNADEIAKIARHAVAVIDRGKLGPMDFQDIGVNRFMDDGRPRLGGTEESAHGKSSGDVSTQFGKKPIKKPAQGVIPDLSEGAGVERIFRGK
jgi:hypothetical protein